MMAILSAEREPLMAATVMAVTVPCCHSLLLQENTTQQVQGRPTENAVRNNSNISS